jgi:hypothetical protein
VPADLLKHLGEQIDVPAPTIAGKMPGRSNAGKSIAHLSS